MEMPQPTEAHKKLERLTGVWVGDEHMQPSQWCSEPTTAQGRSDSRLDLGGFAVITDYTQSKDGQVTFSGHGVYTYDAQEDMYLLHWWDCMGMGPEIFKGGWEGDVFIMRSKGMMGHMRMTSDHSTAGELSSKMECSEDGESWNLMFDAIYTKE